eukprot:2217371-Heterocapsa_arctica.AAC.1
MLHLMSGFWTKQVILDIFNLSFIWSLLHWKTFIILPLKSIHLDILGAVALELNQRNNRLSAVE